MRWILAALVFAASAAHGQNQFRCETADHKRISYSGTPCEADLLCSKWDGNNWSPLLCQRAKRGDNPCRNEATCWGRLAFKDADAPCQRAIELMAKHQAEWTNAFGEKRLAPVRWQDEEAATIVYGGDKIKMQNGFGAWTNMVYECTWDSARMRVIDVSVKPRTE